MGVHVGNYMKLLQGSDADAYKRQFSQFIKNGITGDSVEAMYTKAHAAIRADPEAKSVKKQKPADFKQKRWTKKSLNKEQRKDRVKQVKASFLRRLEALRAE
jgi:large subunit ribosomal protein L5e